MMTTTTDSKPSRMTVVGNVSIADEPGYPLPEAGVDPLAPAAWPKVIGSLSLLLGVLGICFIPPPEAMAVVAPKSQGAIHLFPSWYEAFGVAILALAVLLHIGLALCGVAAMRYSPRLILYYVAYALAYAAYILVFVFMMINIMTDTSLAPLNQTRRINVLQAERTFYYVMSGSLIWPAFLICWFLSPTITGQVKTWGTAAFRRRLLQRKHRRARG